MNAETMNANKETTMTRTYYAVCNVNGPISVNLGDHDTVEAAVAAFESIDPRAKIDECAADAEDELDICGEDMGEETFARALREAGCAQVRDLSPIVNAHAGTVAHLADGWTLWAR